MLNKRKALIGWLVYTLGKPIAKRRMKSKARGAAGSRTSIAAIVAGAGALLGGLMFWRRRRGQEEGPSGT